MELCDQRKPLLSFFFFLQLMFFPISEIWGLIRRAQRLAARARRSAGSLSGRGCALADAADAPPELLRTAAARPSLRVILSPQVRRQIWAMYLTKQIPVALFKSELNSKFDLQSSDRSSNTVPTSQLYVPGTGSLHLSKLLKAQKSSSTAGLRSSGMPGPSGWLLRAGDLQDVWAFWHQAVPRSCGNQYWSVQLAKAVERGFCSGPAVGFSPIAIPQWQTQRFVAVAKHDYFNGETSVCCFWAFSLI